MRLLVLGGSGFVGRAVVEVAVERGWHSPTTASATAPPSPPAPPAFSWDINNPLPLLTTVTSGSSTTRYRYGPAALPIGATISGANYTYFTEDPLGAPAPELHVSDEVSEERFSIAGAKPGQRVSWQVTGVRQDVWAEEGSGGHHAKPSPNAAPTSTPKDSKPSALNVTSRLMAKPRPTS